VATTTGAKGEPVEIVRSEKIDLFAERVREEINAMRAEKAGGKSLKIIS
jgi:hypothetical protein